MLQSSLIFLLFTPSRNLFVNCTAQNPVRLRGKANLCWSTVQRARRVRLVGSIAVAGKLGRKHCTNSCGWDSSGPLGISVDWCIQTAFATATFHCFSRSSKFWGCCLSSEWQVLKHLLSRAQWENSQRSEWLRCSELLRTMPTDIQKKGACASAAVSSALAAVASSTVHQRDVLCWSQRDLVRWVFCFHKFCNWTPIASLGLTKSGCASVSQAR